MVNENTAVSVLSEAAPEVMEMEAGFQTDGVLEFEQPTGGDVAETGVFETEKVDDIKTDILLKTVAFKDQMDFFLQDLWDVYGISESIADDGGLPMCIHGCFTEMGLYEGFDICTAMEEICAEAKPRQFWVALEHD